MTLDTTDFDRDYNERFAPTWEFERNADGVLLVRYNHGAYRTPTSDRPVERDDPSSLATSERLWSHISHDPANRVVILTGNHGVFSEAWETTRPRGFYNADMWARALYSVPRSLDAFLDIPTLVIGAVNGPAHVHGEYLLLCDIVIAAEGAAFGDTPHFANGHVPGDGVNVVWPLLLGANRGRDFLLSSPTLDAHQALELGLVSEVVPDDELIPRCHEVAARLLRADQLTMRFTAMALRQHLKMLLHQHLPHSMALEGIAFIDQSQRAPD